MLGKNKWKLEALLVTSLAGGFLVLLCEKNWLEAIIKTGLSDYEVDSYVLLIILGI